MPRVDQIQCTFSANHHPAYVILKWSQSAICSTSSNSYVIITNSKTDAGYRCNTCIVTGMYGLLQQKVNLSCSQCRNCNFWFRNVWIPYVQHVWPARRSWLGGGSLFATVLSRLDPWVLCDSRQLRTCWRATYFYRPDISTHNMYTIKARPLPLTMIAGVITYVRTAEMPKATVRNVWHNTTRDVNSSSKCDVTVMFNKLTIMKQLTNCQQIARMFDKS